MIGRSARRAIAGVLDAAPHDDHELLGRFTREGDQLAFAALVRRHGPMVLAACRRMLGDEHEAEDAFQATFMVLARRGRSLREGGPLGPWLYGVAWRVARRLRQASARGPVPTGDFPDPPSAPAPPDPVALRELREVLDDEVRRLPEKYRAPVVLCYFQGKTYVEAAESLGCPHGTVSVRLARARELLRDRLTRRGVTLSSGALAAGLAAGPAAGVPVRLLEESARVSGLVAASEPLAGGLVADRVVTLTEGVLRAMWMTKIKGAAGAVVLLLVLGVGLGGGVVRPGPVAVAQQPPPAGRADAAEPDFDLEREARELAALRRQLEAREARLSELRQTDAFDKIAAGIEQLRAAAKGRPELVPAVDEFARAFGSLKSKFHGEPGLTMGLMMDERNFSILEMAAIHSDGKVVRVDADRGEVLLDVGGDADLKVGQVFRSYQPGRLNPDQTGWIEVIEVRPMWSVGRITHEFGPRAPLQAGDIVQTDREKGPEPPIPNARD